MMTSMLSQEKLKDLVARSQSGDDKAFERLLAAFEPLRRKQVRRVCATTSAHDEEEIRQVVDCGIWEAVTTYDDATCESSISCFIASKVQVAVNRLSRGENRYYRPDGFILVSRDELREREVSNEGDNYRNAIPDPDAKVEDDSVEELTKKDLCYELLLWLSPQRKRVLQLIYWDEMTSDEASEVMGVATRTVNLYHSFALRDLRFVLYPDFSDGRTILRLVRERERKQEKRRMHSGDTLLPWWRRELAWLLWMTEEEYRRYITEATEQASRAHEEVAAATDDNVTR